MNDVGSLPRASLLIRYRDSCGIGVGHYLRFLVVFVSFVLVV
jgi:hypothetical protein